MSLPQSRLRLRLLLALPVTLWAFLRAAVLSLPSAELADRLLTTPEAADYLRVAPATLYQWTWRGIGPRSYRVGGRRRYRKADLDKFLEESV